MHRQPLLRLLDRYLVQYPDEADCVHAMARFARAHEACFERSLEIGHLTGSAWVVDASGERVLLTLHRKIGRWMQLGGHADGESDLLTVALREAEEESGLTGIEPLASTLFDIDIHEIPEREDEPAHLHYDCRFLLRAAGPEEYRVSDESHALAWIELERVPEFTREESVLRMARKWAETRGVG